MRLWNSVVIGTAALPAIACQSLSDYSTTTEQQYAGCVVPAEFVLAGVSPTTELCLTLDANNLQTGPGAISSSDGRFTSAPLRPIPQLWNDPLSTFTFGEGRTKNLLYVASPNGDAGGGDVTVILSLMAGALSKYGSSAALRPLVTRMPEGPLPPTSSRSSP